MGGVTREPSYEVSSSCFLLTKIIHSIIIIADIAVLVPFTRTGTFRDAFNAS